MERRHILFLLGFILQIMCGCEEKEGQSQPLLLTVEGDAVIKEAIERVLRANLNIYIHHGNPNHPGSIEYSIKIVRPDPNKDYSILRVTPDPNTKYSMMIIDPRTQQPPTTIAPNTLHAILKELEKRQKNASKK